MKIHHKCPGEQPEEKKITAKIVSKSESKEKVFVCGKT
jgi:hypothetical protein